MRGQNTKFFNPKKGRNFFPNLAFYCTVQYTFQSGIGAKYDLYMYILDLSAGGKHRVKERRKNHRVQFPNFKISAGLFSSAQLYFKVCVKFFFLLLHRLPAICAINFYSPNFFTQRKKRENIFGKIFRYT